MKKNQKRALEVGAGIAAVAAAAAGVYFMTGKNAKNRKKVAKWASNFQEDVILDLNKAGKATKATYNKIVDSAAKNYKGLKNVSATELAAMASELKSSWDTISAELSTASQSVRKAIPKVAKAAKATAKKTVAKKVAGKAKKAVVKVAKKATKKTVKKASKRR